MVGNPRYSIILLCYVDMNLGRMSSREELESGRLGVSGRDKGPDTGDPPRESDAMLEKWSEASEENLPTKGNDGEPPRKKEKVAPFVLGEGIPPVPSRLVSRIWDDEYVDMAELLRDNFEAERRDCSGRMPQSGPQSASHTKPLRREVPDILS